MGDYYRNHVTLLGLDSAVQRWVVSVNVKVVSNIVQPGMAEVRTSAHTMHRTNLNPDRPTTSFQ